MHVALLLVVIASDQGRFVPTPAPVPYPDANCATRGAVNGSAQGLCGHKSFDAGIDAVSVDAGVLVSSVLEGQQGAQRKITSHQGASTFANSMVWDQEPANTRDLDTFTWGNGGTVGMGLNMSTPASPRLSIYGAISPYSIDNRSSGSVSAITLQSNLSGAANNAAVIFDQTNARVSGTCQYDFKNAGTHYACFLPTSNFSQELGELSVSGQVSADGDSSHGAFLVGQNGSGTIALECTQQGSGCYLPLLTHQTPNANVHGSLNVQNAEWLGDGGFLLNLGFPGGINYTPAGNTDNVFSVDFSGGFGNLLRGASYGAGAHQFPPCPDPSPPINTFGKGTAAGSFHFGTDTAHYYLCKTGDLPDAGNTGYKQMAESNPVFFPPVLINAALSVATIGGWVSPQENPVNLDAINFYVSAAGSGGSSNANVRATNGEAGTCDFSFACNLGTGPRRVTGTGLGCTAGLRGTTWTWTITTLGACSGSPPTWVGDMTPEGHWR